MSFMLTGKAHGPVYKVIVKNEYEKETPMACGVQGQLPRLLRFIADGTNLTLEMKIQHGHTQCECLVRLYKMNHMWDEPFDEKTFTILNTQNGFPGTFHKDSNGETEIFWVLRPYAKYVLDRNDKLIFKGSWEER